MGMGRDSSPPPEKGVENYVWMYMRIRRHMGMRRDSSPPPEKGVENYVWMYMRIHGTYGDAS